jgi:hypothetical protein
MGSNQSAVSAETPMAPSTGNGQASSDQTGLIVAGGLLLAGLGLAGTAATRRRRDER